MAPSNDELRDMANQAEKDLNTYQAKTGAARGRDIDEAGVDTRVEKEFPGAKVKYDDGRRRIPTADGGDVIDPYRYTRGYNSGSELKAAEGPERTPELDRGDRGGDNDNEDIFKSVMETDQTGKDVGGYNEAYDLGADARRSNVGRSPPGVGGSEHPGSKYEYPESVPDQRAEQGNIPGENIRQNIKGDQSLHRRRE